MIKTKEQLETCIKTESDILKDEKSLKNVFFPKLSLQFLKALRIFEYHYNSTGVFHKIACLFAYRKYYRLMCKSGISIPKNTCDIGLTLYHHGSIVINSATRIGKNCCIMNNVNIGTNNGGDKAPQIGNNVYIGPGAVLFGDIIIADGCYIGANTVVTKSFLEPHSVIVGVPAKIIKYDTISWWEKNGLKRIK